MRFVADVADLTSGAVFVSAVLRDRTFVTRARTTTLYTLASVTHCVVGTDRCPDSSSCMTFHDFSGLRRLCARLALWACFLWYSNVAGVCLDRRLRTEDGVLASAVTVDSCLIQRPLAHDQQA